MSYARPVVVVENPFGAASHADHDTLATHTYSAMSTASSAVTEFVADAESRRYASPGDVTTSRRAAVHTTSGRQR